MRKESGQREMKKKKEKEEERKRREKKRKKKEKTIKAYLDHGILTPLVFTT